MKNKFSIYILVIVIASLLWIQQMLLKKHIEVIRVNVQLENIPTNLILADEKIIELPVTIEARGMDFMFLKFSKMFFVSNCKGFVYGKNKLNISDTDLSYPDRITIVIKNILNKNDQNIFLDKSVTQNFPVDFLFSSVKDEEFFLKNKISDRYKKIEVKGPESVLNKFKKIQTVKITKKMLKNNKLYITLMLPDERMQVADEILVYDVEKTRLITKTISLIPVSYPLDMNIAIIPQKVSIMIKGPEDIVSKLDNKNIAAKIDSEKIKKRDFSEVEFELPAGVKLIEYTPRQIQIVRND